MKLNPALTTAIVSMTFASLPAYAATSIPIPNGDFELAGGYAPGWSGLPAVTTPINFAHTNAPKPGNETLGTQFVYVVNEFPSSSPGIGFQTLTTIYLPDQVYQFQGYTVDPGSLNMAGFELGYDAGSGFVSLGVNTYAAASYASWTLVEGVTYQTPSSGGPVGQNIIVRIRNEANGDGGGVWFDGLSLSSNAIPEPSSAVLSAVACVGMIFLRRRQRA